MQGNPQHVGYEPSTVVQDYTYTAEAIHTAQRSIVCSDGHYAANGMQPEVHYCYYGNWSAPALVCAPTVCELTHVDDTYRPGAIPAYERVGNTSIFEVAGGKHHGA